MKILLTGHKGFIGTHLCDYLSMERMDNCANIKEWKDLGWKPKVNVIEYIRNKYHLTSA